MEDIIITQPWGGLGDNLQFSTLPELYSKKGHKVYISNNNIVRNHEIYDLVWGCNPYVEGLSDKLPNCGNKDVILEHPCVVPAWEKFYGFGEVNKYPKIYYKCRVVDSLNNKILVDLGYSSVPNHVREYVKTYTISSVMNLMSNIFPNRDLLQIKYQNNLKGDEFVAKDNITLPGIDTHIINNIFEYCDSIYSCYGFICLFSGASVLASAIKQNENQPLIYVFQYPGFGSGYWHSTYFFDNITYVDFIS
jgi:hypothetical protein